MAISKNADNAFTPLVLVGVLSRLGLHTNTRLIVAFSGGLDSCVLLHALCSLRQTQPWPLRVVHVDHGLQAASAEWARHAEKFCGSLNVPCAIERVHIADIREHGVEAAARQARYDCLARYVGKNDVLLTAHHADDQAETLLLQLLRGAGTHGLAAMPEVMPFSAGQHVRPLLGFTRPQLARYAEQEKLRWVDDPSNADPRFSRNYIRNEVFPLLEARWPGAALKLAHTAALSAEAVELLDAVAAKDWRFCRHENASTLSITALRSLSLSRQRNLIRFWLRQQGFRAPSAKHLDHVMDQIAQDPRTRRAIVRWPDAEVCRYRDALIAQKPPQIRLAALKLPWNPVEPLLIPGAGLLHATATQGEGLSQERVANSSLTVGWRQGGEICRLRGRAHHHKLKKLLQNAGIPPWERERLPLIYVNNELAAVSDLWVCEPYAARADEAGWKLQLELAQTFIGGK